VHGFGRVDKAPYSDFADPATVEVIAILDAHLIFGFHPADGADEVACVPDLRGRDIVERTAAGGRATAPESVGVALPVLEFEFGAIAVPVDQDHGEITVLLDEQDTGVRRVPAAHRDERCRGELADPVVHHCSVNELSRSAGQSASEVAALAGLIIQTSFKRS
jgi:hypothetical protein